MTDIVVFILNSILLGIGLAMDAFTVSMANGLHEPHMKKDKKVLIAGMFALFQFLMPVIGWCMVRFIVDIFDNLKIFIPWIALVLLLFIGIKMIIEAVRDEKVPGEADSIKRDEKRSGLTMSLLIAQAVATSIDALSVGFTIASYEPVMAIISAVIIAVVTFVICIAGIHIGIRFGLKLKSRAEILGGCVLIIIGIEIFIKGFFWGG